jgi:hypothetical protein
LAIISGGDFDEAAGFVGAPVNVRARVRRARRGTERADGSFESRVGGSSNRGARRCAPAKRDGCGEASVNRFRHARRKNAERAFSAVCFRADRLCVLETHTRRTPKRTLDKVETRVVGE